MTEEQAAELLRVYMDLRANGTSEEEIISKAGEHGCDPDCAKTWIGLLNTAIDIQNSIN